jgi:RNA polymerase sigma-70 factor (ECF subfamily)
LDIPDAEQRYRGAVGSDETPEQLYERQWAATTVMKVLNQLRAEAAAQGHAELLGNLLSTLTGDKPSIPYADLARRLGMSEGAVKMAAHRLRKRYRVLFRKEIAHTVDRPEEVEEEIAHLFQVLSR